MRVNNLSKLLTGIIISFSFCLILAFLLSSTSVNQNKTYGDGLSEEQLPPFNIDDKRSSPRTILDSLKDFVTDNGGIYISLTWVPKKPEPNTSSTMYLKFLNAQDNSPLSADITYGIKITDERGNSVIERSGQTALFNQSGSQEIVLPRKGTYGIQIYVEGLSPLSTDSLDTSRNGIARGYFAVG